MEPVIPQPFTFESGEKAILLLHGFTGNSADVRMLGRFLEGKGYSSHAPQYKGHGGGLPEILAQSTLDDWWQDVLAGYQLLQDKGYKKIAVAGISLGGLFSLKLAMEKPVVAVIPMCAPMGFQKETILKEMLISYASSYKKLEGKPDEQIKQEIQAFSEKPIPAVNGVLELVSEVKSNLQKIEAPIFVIQGRQDHVIDIQSPEIIVNHVSSEEKNMNWYEQSGHIITLEKERNKLEDDVYQYLETINWIPDMLFDMKETEAPQIWW